VYAEWIIELVVAMQTMDGLAQIAYPDSKVSGRAESQSQKQCEILVDHGRVLVPIKLIEEDNDAIQILVLLSQYLELHEQSEGQPRSIWKIQMK
jgi:hypothetical protein